MLGSETRVLLVLSGKGGVGKSSVACQVAVSLVDLGFSVGLLDVDLCGPSVPQMFGIVGESVVQSEDGWVPVKVLPQFEVMSIGFLISSEKKDDAIIWRGPKKSALIKQFFNDVAWSPGLDFLVVDTPPGTSDEHLALVEHVLQAQKRSLDAIVVTTPQSMALIDVKKEIAFCNKVGITILGLIENMSCYNCPHCNTSTPIFATGGGHILATETNIPFLGQLPFDNSLSIALDLPTCSADTPNQIGRIERIHSTASFWLVKSIVQALFGKKNI